MPQKDHPMRIQNTGRASWFRDIITRKPSAPAQSLATVDTLKGISILMMLYIHVGNVWCAPDFLALMRFQWYVTDFMGPALYLTLSVIGTMASSAAQNVHGKMPLASRRRLLRASFLLIYGEVINLLTAGRQGIYHVTAWNVITTIAVFSLLMPFILRVPKAFRVAIIVLIVVTYYPFMQWAIADIFPHGVSLGTTTAAMLQDPRTLVYWLLFYSDMMTPVYSWLIVPIVASLLYEKVVILNKPHAKDKLRGEMKKMAVIGASFVAVSLLTSLYIIPEYNTAVFEALMLPSPYFTWPIPSGLPPFLVRHVPQYIFYCIGLECLLFSGIGWIQLVKGKKLPLEDKINNIGKLSITIFALSFILSLIPLDLPLAAFYFVVIPVIVLVAAWCGFWTRRLNRIGSVEWMLDVYAGTISHFLDARQRKDAP